MLDNLLAKKIVVTGGAGFIGSHTVDLLLKEGCEVVVLDNLSTGKITHLDLQHPNLSFVEGDILEYPLIEEIIYGCDAVLHLAAIASVPQSIADPIYTFQVNTQGLLHILQAIHRCDDAIRLVYASSAAVYGQNARLPCRDDIFLESALIAPYALQKKQAEEYAALFHKMVGIKSLGLRYFNVYGQGQDPVSSYSGVISRFIEHYKVNEPITLYGDGSQTRDFIHVSDTAHANLLALQSDYQGVLNIATGKSETLRNLIAYMEAVGGYSAQIRHLPSRAGDIHASCAAIQSAKKAINFSATLSLKEGIKKMMLGE